MRDIDTGEIITEDNEKIPSGYYHFSIHSTTFHPRDKMAKAKIILRIDPNSCFLGDGRPVFFGNFAFVISSEYIGDDECESTMNYVGKYFNDVWSILVEAERARLFINEKTREVMNERGVMLLENPELRPKLRLKENDKIIQKEFLDPIFCIDIKDKDNG